jgi:hypothetical protein
VTDNDKAGGRYQAAANLQAEVERLEGALAKAEAERDALKEEDGCADYLAVCQALGIVYQADGFADHAGPIADVLREIAVLKAAKEELAETPVYRDAFEAQAEALASQRASLAERDAVIGELAEAGRGFAIAVHGGRPQSTASLALDRALTLAAPHAARGAAVIREAEERGAAAALAAVDANHGDWPARPCKSCDGEGLFEDGTPCGGCDGSGWFDLTPAEVIDRVTLAAEGKEAGQ